MKKKLLALVICFVVFLSGCGKTNSISTMEDQKNADTSTTDSTAKYIQYQNMSVKEIVESLTLEQKAGQMVQPAIYEIDKEAMKAKGYGSVLSKADTVTFEEWKELVDDLQEGALSSDAGIPYIYGQDDVHGVNYCKGAVIFPHNIGVGAANNAELLYKVGLATADEAKLCHMLWNFAPCVAQSADPRWGRTYESYGSDLELIKELSTTYTKGLIDGGVVACAKHFFGDGNAKYGTGEDSDVARLIDRGDAQLSEEEMKELLSVYQAQIDAGVQTIMVSHTSLNGTKMHENTKYLQYLKNDMGFDGMIVSDWKSVDNTSGSTYKEQVINVVNAGVDMLMEVDTCNEAIDIIVNAVKDGSISEERVNDAVERIIKVKKDIGLFEDPFCKNMKTVQTKTGSKEYRELAKQMVEESLVLLKNENNVLPLKEGTKIYVTGPAANNASVQCGGWTIDWNGSPTKEIAGVTTILKGLQEVAKEKGIEVITDKNQASKADVVLLCVGEVAYAEWNGDTQDLELCGKLGCTGNQRAIEEVSSLGKPVVTCIVAGRHVIIKEYFDQWDSVVMCYLPGSEGTGVANVLVGDSNFKGKLPSPWYDSVEQIGTEESWLEKGYGLVY